MIVQRQPHQITRWFLLFWPQSATWLGRLVPGRFKHVSAVGYSEACRTWVWYDVAPGQTEIIVMPPGEATERLLAAKTRGCSVLMMDARPPPHGARRLAFLCVPAMAHLVGVIGYGAAPDDFWRCCLRNGAQVVFDGTGKSLGNGNGPAMGHARADGRAGRLADGDEELGATAPSPG